MSRIVVVLLSCSTIISCGQIKITDSSNDPEYMAVIGKKFKAKEELWAIGVTTDENYKKGLDYTILTSGVGFTGPEVQYRKRCCNGTIFIITRVLTSGLLFISYVDYVVEEVGTNNFKNSELRIHVLESVNDSNYGLDKSVFERID